MKQQVSETTVTMFTMASCPYCRRALQYMEDLFARHPEYAELSLVKIDEVEEPELADQYDYYYVPTYYIGTQKVHEGAASPEQIEAVFAQAYSLKQANE